MKTVYKVELDSQTSSSQEPAQRFWIAADNGLQVENALRDMEHLVSNVKAMHGVVPVATDMDYVLPDEAENLRENVRQFQSRRRSA